VGHGAGESGIQVRAILVSIHNQINGENARTAPADFTCSGLQNGIVMCLQAAFRHQRLPGQP
jgi:hypothetical protein